MAHDEHHHITSDPIPVGGARVSGHTSLPAWAIDLIRDGTTDQRGHHGIFSAVLSTANSAVQHGHTRTEWMALILDLPLSRLGRQLSVERGKTRPARNVIADLHKAWDKAVVFCDVHPTLTRDDYTNEIDDVRTWFDHHADTIRLTPAELAVIGHAIDSAERNGSARPTMPRRQVMAATGLTERQVRNALATLDAAGILRCEDRGQPGGPRAKGRRAACYRLPTADVRAALVPPKSRDVGHPPGEMWGSTDPSSGAAPGEMWGSSPAPAPTTVILNPTDPSDPTLETPMHSVTLTASTPEALVEMLAKLHQAGVMAPTPAVVPAGPPQLRLVPPVADVEPEAGQGAQ